MAGIIKIKCLYSNILARIWAERLHLYSFVSRLKIRKQSTFMTLWPLVILHFNLFFVVLFFLPRLISIVRRVHPWCPSLTSHHPTRPGFTSGRVCEPSSSCVEAAAPRRPTSQRDRPPGGAGEPPTCRSPCDPAAGGREASLLLPLPLEEATGEAEPRGRSPRWLPCRREVVLLLTLLLLQLLPWRCGWRNRAGQPGCSDRSGALAASWGDTRLDKRCEHVSGLQIEMMKNSRNKWLVMLSSDWLIMISN